MATLDDVSSRMRKGVTAHFVSYSGISRKDFVTMFTDKFMRNWEYYEEDDGRGPEEVYYHIPDIIAMKEAIPDQSKREKYKDLHQVWYNVVTDKKGDQMEYDLASSGTCFRLDALSNLGTKPIELLSDAMPGIQFDVLSIDRKGNKSYSSIKDGNAVSMNEGYVVFSSHKDSWHYTLSVNELVGIKTEEENPKMSLRDRIFAKALKRVNDEKSLKDVDKGVDKPNMELGD